VQKFWSLFFAAVLLACLVLVVVTPAMGWGLPLNIASFGDDVDFLFHVILVFTGFFFVLTEAILIYAMWRFTYRPGHKSDYTHGNHKLEILWTAVPAGILLFIAFAQIGAWERIKYQTRMPKPDQVIQVTARQWEWRVRYPSDVNLPETRARVWAESPESDDLRMVNEIHTWHEEANGKNEAYVKIYLKTQDVIHSLYFPNLRLKQDALPGKTIPMWFRVTRPNMKWDPETKTCEEPKDLADRYEFSCAELCGGRHYAMRGRLYVHPSRADFDQWFAHAKSEQNTRDPESQPGATVATAE
jgi:cytochrome c oxidase subunit 2